MLGKSNKMLEMNNKSKTPTGWMIKMEGKNQNKKKKPYYRDKTRIIGITIVAGLFLSTLVLFSTMLILSGKGLQGILMIVTAAILAVFGIKVLKEKFDEVRKGFPVEDERSKKAKVYAGYYAFLFAVWWLLGVGWYDNIMTDRLGVSPFRDPSQATGLGIIGIAIAFGVFWAYFQWKGTPE